MPKSNHISNISDQHQYNRDIMLASNQQQSHPYNTKQALTNICYVNSPSTITTTATTTTTTTSTVTTSKQTSETGRNSISNNNSNTQNVATTSSSNTGSGTGTIAGGSGGNSGTIIGHYELKKTLGKGNFSTVKLAQHRITQHLVAIKVVKTSVLSEDNLMKINREIDVLKKLGKHENVIRLYQVIKTKRYFMLVTEYCADGELYDYLVKNGKLSEANSCKYFLQILSAIEYLHDHNVVHRDLKAENLLLTNDLKTIKIVDFGFANYYKPDNLLSTWCGSPPYAAPELFKGLEYVGPPVDIWSVGVVLYVMVCGSLPFDGHNLVYLKSRVLSGKFRIPYFMSTECEGLIRGMLRLDPERRFCIRQIRSHCWTVKYINARKENTTEVANQQVIYMDPATSNMNKFNIKNLSSLQCSTDSSDKKDNSNNHTGQSSDFEEDKRKSADTATEDSVMTCLSGSDEKNSLTTNQRNLTAPVKPPLTKNFVDTEIANAVSNMSLDSNTSAMSVSQSIDTTSTISNQGSFATNIEQPKLGPKKADHPGSGYRGFTKDNSIDDQIIDFMIDNLKVADSQSLIRQSIADDKYDDLHAIYRLLKDDPKIVIEVLSSSGFKIPSLPLISLSKQQSYKKPSITTGFFNPPTKNQIKPDETPQAKITAYQVSSNGLTESDETSDKRTATQSLAMNLVTHTDFNSQKVPKLRERERKSEDNQTWAMPPQLFLTPPSENRYSSVKNDELGQSVSNESDSPTTSAHFNREVKQVVARHSFDSTIQNFAELSNIPGTSNNKLALTNCAKQCLWDSSILDSLGVSTPPLNSNQNFLVRPSDNSDQSFSSMHGDPKKSPQIFNNIAGITTNLPQIGAQSDNQSTTDQNLLLAQLNSLALSAAVTQSSMLSHWQANEQRLQAPNTVEFTPNNLSNQNHNVMNNLAMPNNLNSNGIPNLCLLDPSGLISGLERRASDGQASYSSLTTNVSVNDTSTLVQEGYNDNKTFITGLVDVAATFLSSSSNQLSSNLQNTQQNQCNVPLDSNSQITGLSNDQQQSLSNNSMIMNHIGTQHHTLTRNGQGTEQTDPLDLTKGSREVTPQDRARLSFGGETHAQLSSRQQNKQPGQQRSHSTTSASVLFQNAPTSATTSPRSSLLISGTMSHNVQLPYCLVSPSSISLTGGGPGHLSTRRKRHSLENETRGHHHKTQAPNHYYQYQTSQLAANFHTSNNSNESSRSLRQNPAKQYLQNFSAAQYPMSSHIGQLRNFAQTFSYKKLSKKQESPRICKQPSFMPYSQQTEYASMDFNNNNCVPDDDNIDK